MPSEHVTVRTRDGDCPAHVMVPAGDGPWPAVTFYMDAGGIRPAMQDMARHLADAGFVVLLPDLFYHYGPYSQGGQRRHRAMAEALQHPPAALVARLSASRTGGRYLANGTRQLSATRSPHHCHATDDALTSNLSHQMGAGQVDQNLLDSLCCARYEADGLAKHARAIRFVSGS